MKRTEPGPPSADVLRRLALPRYLFGEAERVLSRPGPYSGGVATSLLQDAIEALLLLLAQESKVGVTERETFPGLLQKVGETNPSVLGHSAPMLRLNKARVGFKHQGISVSREDASIFAANAGAFLAEASEALRVDFWSVSLIDLVGHRRTQNWLHQAEEYVSKGKYQRAVLCAAKAAAVYLDYRGSLPMGFERELYAVPTGGAPLSWPHRYSEFAEEDLAEFSARVGTSLNRLQTYLTLIARGIDIADYRRFQAVTPHVSMSEAGTFAVAWGPRHYPVLGVSEADAVFSINFVVDMAIRLQETAPQQRGDVRPPRAHLYRGS